MAEHQWLWQARCIRVIDGDTIDVEIDAGFHSIRTERLRIYGVNCPELHGPTRDAGLAAKRYTQQWLDNVPASTWPLTIQTFKSDVFGRYLALVWATDPGNELGQALLNSGLAVVFHG